MDEITAEPHFEPRHGHRIVCAAIQLADGRVICGVRHFDTLMRALLPSELVEAHRVLSGHEEGFVDNLYKFRDRNAAWDIAAAAGQIKDGPGVIEGCLFSEDLW
jgi:hypothetical protein